MGTPSNSYAVVGSGPAGLMAATVLSDAGHRVELFEARAGLGRKLLIAGSSGLNISHELPLQEFAGHYSSPTQPAFFDRLNEFTPQDWIQFIEKRLGLETFLGTSGRYFVREMKASQLLKNWASLLEKNGVQIRSKHELSDFAAETSAPAVRLEFSSGTSTRHDGAVFALGGGSWEDREPKWPEFFSRKGLTFTPFTPANVGYEIRWPERFLKEALRQPLKSIVFETARGKKAGELLVTEYGIEGTPVYFLGAAGPAWIDLKPALTSEEIIARLQQTKENLSPIRRVDRLLGLAPAAFALVFHLAPTEVKADLEKLARFVKRVPLTLLGPRPLSEAISSRGGVRMSELSSDLMLKRFPGIALAGEMLDWDAPTGGFLIQGSVLQGVIAARGLLHPIQR